VLDLGLWRSRPDVSIQLFGGADAALAVG